MDYSTVLCEKVTASYDEDREATLYGETTIPTNFNEKKATSKTKMFYLLIIFLLVTIVLLINVSIYCYLKKTLSKTKKLLPFNFTNNKSKDIILQIYNIYKN